MRFGKKFLYFTFILPPKLYFFYFRIAVIMGLASCSFATALHAQSNEQEGTTAVYFNLGIINVNALDKVQGPEYDTSGGAMGKYEATLKDLPKGDITAGVTVEHFFNKNNNLGLGAGLAYAEMNFDDQLVFLKGELEFDHYFPAFSFKGAIAHLGPVYRMDKQALFAGARPYFGGELVGYAGIITNTNYNEQSVIDTGSFEGSDYGQNGTSDFSAFGASAKAGLMFDLGSNSVLGLEMKYTKIEVDGGAMRSFKDGFTAMADFTTIGLRYQINSF